MAIIDVEVDWFHTTPFRMGTEEEQLASLERYHSRVFSVKDAFITAKRFHDWHRAGLLPMDIPQGMKNLMNLPEFIWVKLVDKLRQLGTHQAHIRAIKEYLFAEIDGPALMDEVMQSAEVKTQLARMMDQSVMGEEDRQELRDALEAGEPLPLAPGMWPRTLMDSLLFTLLLRGEEIGLMLLPDGQFRLWAASLGEPRLDYTHAYLSISSEMHIFRASGIWEEKTEKLNALTDEEWQVIWAIRDRRAKEVTVSFQEKGERRQMDISTTMEERMSAEQQEMLVNLIKLGKYNEVKIKANGSDTLYIERRKRKRV